MQRNLSFRELTYWKRKGYVYKRSLDTNDCGPACLAAILEYYGLKVTVTQIANDARTDANGTTLLGMIKAAEHYGMTAYAYQVNVDGKIEEVYALLSSGCPFIAHLLLENGVRHFITVYELTDSEIIFSEPSKGPRKCSKEDFMKQFTGNVIILKPGENFEARELDRPKPLIFKVIQREKKRLLCVVLFSLVVSIIGVVSSFYIKYLVDYVIPNNNVHWVMILVPPLLGIIAFKNILEVIRMRIVLRLSMDIDKSILSDYFFHLLALPMSFFDSRQSGGIITRYSDTNKIREAISISVASIAMDVVLTVVGGAALYKICFPFFFICTILLMVYFFIAEVFYSKIKRENEDVLEKNSKVLEYLIELSKGMPIIKAYRCENKVLRQLKKRFDEYIFNRYAYGVTISNQLFLRRLAGDLFQIIILSTGAAYTIRSNISIGSFMGGYVLLAYYINPIERLLELQAQIQEAIVANERLQQVMEMPVEEELVIRDEDKDSEIKNLNNAISYPVISFKSVIFRYGYRRVIIKDLTFNIKRGEHVAFVGESGAGKSTIIKMLMRFYKPESGCIEVDGRNIESIPIDVLRQRIAYVPQDSSFFSGSIKDNIMMWSKEDDEEHMIDMCKKLMIHEKIMSLPKQYDDIIAENASNLSGGEKQCLSIARALMLKPDILILDEATSNLDTITERKIERLLEGVTENITVIKIAHRLSTVFRSDNIYVISNGKIVESGSHEELLIYGGVYRTMWDMQEGIM